MKKDKSFNFILIHYDIIMFHHTFDWFPFDFDSQLKWESETPQVASIIYSPSKQIINQLLQHTYTQRGWREKIYDFDFSISFAQSFSHQFSKVIYCFNLQIHSYFLCVGECSSRPRHSSASPHVRIKKGESSNCVILSTR
jgi:hypothetical protein